jgi:hypothetical protein
MGSESFSSGPGNVDNKTVTSDRLDFVVAVLVLVSVWCL